MAMRSLCATALMASALVSAMASSVAAACPDQAAIDAYVAEFRALKASKGLGDKLTLADAECARAKLVKVLPPVLGNVVGYKAGFINEALQKRFEVPAPAYGVMFAKEMVQSGAKLRAQFGARPLYEADLVAVVRSPALADAKTPLEALAHISEIVPFIELPDLAIEGNPLGTALIATNIAFRGGVLGPPVKAEATEAFLASLAAMTVVMSEDREKKELGRVKADVLMGNPVNAAMWLAQALKKDGVALKAGDLLSLGGFFPPAPTKPGITITVRYIGLAGDPAVSVHFD